jgi:hypothetical protein
MKGQQRARGKESECECRGACCGKSLRARERWERDPGKGKGRRTRGARTGVRRGSGDEECKLRSAV